MMKAPVYWTSGKCTAHSGGEVKLGHCLRRNMRDRGNVMIAGAYTAVWVREASVSSLLSTSSLALFRTHACNYVTQQTHQCLNSLCSNAPMNG